MRLPILYTMSWPERVPCSEATWPRLDFVKMGDLTFRWGGGVGARCGARLRLRAMPAAHAMHRPASVAALPPTPPGPLAPPSRQPDHAKYPSMALAYAAGRAGGTMTGVMSAANEQAVELFLEVCVCVWVLKGAGGGGVGGSLGGGRAGRPSMPSPLTLLPLLPCPRAPLLSPQEKISYLDIVRVAEDCCEAHRAELVEAPSLEEIVHYDQWARRHVAERVAKGLAVAA